MAWGRVDDGWWCHPKVMGLGLAARGLWVSALSWSESQGCCAIPQQLVEMVGGDSDLADELIAADLWVLTPDGYVNVPLPIGRRPHVPTALRIAVYERDGYRCVTCGTDENLTLDHVLAWSKGGPDTYENFQTMCRPCNSRKGDA